jgi:hypothetical protein
MNDEEINTLPVVPVVPKTSKKMTDGMWAGVATAASGMFGTAVNAFSPKVRENNLAIAEANARAAESNVVSSKNNTEIDPKLIGFALLVLVVVLLLAFKSKPTV